MKKSGVTMVEALIMIAIMGIISAIGIFSARSYDKGYKYLYSNTFYVLDRALYNAKTQYIAENEYNREAFKEVLISNTGTKKAVSAKSGAVYLCRALAYYINYVSTSCSESRVLDASPTDEDFKNKTPMIVTGNGIRLWISKRYPHDGDTENTTKFFIIYADLNGEKLPNSIVYEETGLNGETKDPDIFAFAALDTGRICPIGVVEVDDRYLTARVRYENSEFETVYSKKSVPLVAAKAIAWGYYTKNKADDEDKEGETGEASETNEDNVLTESPLSYTDYVRKVIYNEEEDSEIYSHFIEPSTSMRDYFNNTLYPDISKRPKLNSTPPKPSGGGGFGCVKHSNDECDVIVDKYLY